MKKIGKNIGAGAAERLQHLRDRPCDAEDRLLLCALRVPGGLDEDHAQARVLT